MKVFLILLGFISTSLKASNQWHMVTFGGNGLGSSGSAERMSTSSLSSFESIDNFVSNLSLNYAYRLSKRFQGGLLYEGFHREYKFNQKKGGSSSQTIESHTFGVFFLYNFHNDFHQSFYLGLSASNTSYEEEISHSFSDAEGKAPTELDDTNQTYEILFGKRISIIVMEFKNLSFSPQVRFFYKTHGKDFDDQGVKYGVGLSLQPIRFDLLF